MKSKGRILSLEEVLEDLFYSNDKLSHDMVLSACDAHPEFRSDILEFAALWSSYEVVPDPVEDVSKMEVTDEDVSLLQSVVLNRLYELDENLASGSSETAARTAIAGLAGGKLKRAAAAAGLGESTSLLTKVLTASITDVPNKVLKDLAMHLNVAASELQKILGLNLAGGISYKASKKPSAPQLETWDSAIRALPVSDEEKRRLIALQENGEST